MRARYTGICYACGHFNSLMVRYESPADIEDVLENGCERCRAQVLMVVDPEAKSGEKSLDSAQELKDLDDTPRGESQ